MVIELSGVQFGLKSSVCAVRVQVKIISIMHDTKFNKPFPSSCLPPLQSESKCEVFVMVISFTLHMNEN